MMESRRHRFIANRDETDKQKQTAKTAGDILGVCYLSISFFLQIGKIFNKYRFFSNEKQKLGTLTARCSVVRDCVCTLLDWATLSAVGGHRHIFSASCRLHLINRASQ